MKQNERIYIAGHQGMVGSALVRRLKSGGYGHLITQTFDELDLRDKKKVTRFFETEKPEHVFLAAAKVGGILANSTYPAEFIRDNLAIQLNVIDAAYHSGVKRLLFLGSSCIYPRDCPQPMSEEYLLTGPLEPTNRPYAIAKIAGIELCWSYNREYGTKYLAVMPTNLYGPGDNYDLNTSHVLPALIKKFSEAKKENKKEVVVWGSGKPRREFLHSSDMADACFFLMNLSDDKFDVLLASDRNDGIPPIVNIGLGSDITICELAELIREIVGFAGKIQWDTAMPDGTPRKLLDVSRLNGLGWFPALGIEDGVRKVIQTYQSESYLS